MIPAGDVGRSAVAGHPGPGPLAVSIPSLGIDAAVTPVRVASSGALGVPSSYAAAGWWGGRPGLDETIPVILVGHVDDHHGPAVFYRVPELLPGAAISVTGSTGAELHYVVDAVRQYSDAHFPVRLVYGSTARPTLRLLTCSGFSWWRRHYEDNTVVFAHLRT